MNRNERIKLAEQTLQIVEQGGYQTAGGNTLSIEQELRSCIENTKFYLPEALDAIIAEAPSNQGQLSGEIEVANETTLQGAKRLVDSGKYARVGVLNFASARNPGGGFLGGSQAQEESLARSTGLYASLKDCSDYYDYHRQHRSGIYTDRIIYSPGCPVFRDDDGKLLEAPYFVDVITSPAPNAGAIQKNTPHEFELIEPCFVKRIDKVLALALKNGCDALVLGAWGCGVFRNDPTMVARNFAHYLIGEGKYAGCFSRIRFSVLDRTDSQSIYTAFESEFGKALTTKES